MPKQTTVIEFDDKEVRDLLVEKDKEALGKPSNSGVVVELLCGDEETITSKARVRVTFNGKVDR